MADEKRLIEANALLDEIRKSKDGHHHTEYDILANHHMEHDVFMDLVDCAPTVDAVEVVHGRWFRKQIGKYTGADEVCCSICGSFVGVVCSETGFRKAIEGMNYCPNCGAKMDGDGN